jgi:hypothetical protein
VISLFLPASLKIYQYHWKYLRSHNLYS